MSIVLALFAQVAQPTIATSLADEVDSPGRTDTTVIYAQIGPVCSVEVAQDEILLSLATTADQLVGEVTYTCNSIDGFTRRVSSLNDGVLRRGAQSIDYFVSQTGSKGLAIPRTRLTSPLIGDVPASGPLTVGTGGLLSIQIPSLAPGLLAGEYRDTLTIEITPN